MDKLKKIFTDLGFANVKSVIASGNILFETKDTNMKKLETTIEAALKKSTGVQTNTILRTQKDIAALIKANPFKLVPTLKNLRTHISFLKHSQKPHLKPPIQGKGYTILSLIDNALCSVIDLNSGKTPDYMAILDKQFNKQITTRTWGTVEKILKTFDK